MSLSRVAIPFGLSLSSLLRTGLSKPFDKLRANGWCLRANGWCLRANGW